MYGPVPFRKFHHFTPSAAQCLPVLVPQGKDHFLKHLSNFPPSHLSIPFWDTPNLISQFKETKQFGKNGITLWFHLHSSLLVRMTFFILFFHLFIGHMNYYVKTYSPGIFVSLNWKR